MTLDATIPLWGVITYILATLGLIAGFVLKVINLEHKQEVLKTAFETRATQIEKSQKKNEDDIWEAKENQKVDSEKVYKSISGIERSLNRITTYFEMMTKGQLKFDNQTEE